MMISLLWPEWTSLRASADIEKLPGSICWQVAAATTTASSFFVGARVACRCVKIREKVAPFVCAGKLADFYPERLGGVSGSLITD